MRRIGRQSQGIPVVFQREIELTVFIIEPSETVVGNAARVARRQGVGPEAHAVPPGRGLAPGQRHEQRECCAGRKTCHGQQPAAAAKPFGDGPHDGQARSRQGQVGITVRPGLKTDLHQANAPARA